MRPRRTNAEVMADTIAILLRDGIIPRDDIVLAKIRYLTGVDRNDLRLAYARIRNEPTISPTKLTTPPPDSPKFQSKKRVRTRATKIIDGVRHLRCTGGVSDGAHWAPEDEFDARPDRPHTKKSKCRDHWLESQRARRIGRDAVVAFDEADLDILYDDAGKPVGIECTRCGSKVGCHCAPEEE